MKLIGIVLAAIFAIAFSALATASSLQVDGLNSSLTAQTDVVASQALNVEDAAHAVVIDALTTCARSKVVNQERGLIPASELTNYDSVVSGFIATEVGWRNLTHSA